MESTEIASRRLGVLASHVHAEDYPASEGLGVEALVCAGGNPRYRSARRRESSVYFARQSTWDGPHFVRHTTTTIVERRPAGEGAKQAAPAPVAPAAAPGPAPSPAPEADQPHFARPTEDATRKLHSARPSGGPSAKPPSVAPGPEPFLYQESMGAAPLFAKAASAEGGQVASEVHSRLPNLGAAAHLPPQFARPALEQPPRRDAGWSPRMDVLETRDEYIVVVELPGVSAEAIRVEICPDGLVISGNRGSESWLEVDDRLAHQKTQGGGRAVYRLKERMFGPFRCVWSIPLDCNTTSVVAEFANGVLQVFLPRTKNVL